MKSPTPIFDAVAEKHGLVRLPYGRRLGEVQRAPAFLFIPGYHEFVQRHVVIRKAPTKEN